MARGTWQAGKEQEWRLHSSLAIVCIWTHYSHESFLSRMNRHSPTLDTHAFQSTWAAGWQMTEGTYLILGQGPQMLQDLCHHCLTQLVVFSQKLGISPIEAVIGVNWWNKPEPRVITKAILARERQSCGLRCQKMSGNHRRTSGNGQISHQAWGLLIHKENTWTPG